MSRFRISLFLLVTFLFAATSLHASDPVKSLTPRYRHWITEEVPYIIESEERKQFLSLKNDTERENFIQAFWDARNPSPGSEINTYKEEHYRRLSYANEHFGNIEAQDGWRSDQGLIYITLGEPQQRANYPNARNVRPLLIWFYQSPTPVLPTHFYIMFYKRSIGEAYTLYSPYQDGPSRLTTGLEDLNVQQKSLQTIRKSLGDEVARTALSLIPTEPVDLNTYTPSMSSDVLLSAIKGLPDNPLTKELIDSHRGREVVSSRILMSSKQADIQAATFREDGGKQTVNYLFLPHEPIRNLIGTVSGNKLGYSLTLQTTVTTLSGRRVYQTQNALQGFMTEEQAEIARNKRFAAEERLPLAPGDYKVTATLTNNLTHVALEESETVVVPDSSEDSLGISRLLTFSERAPGPLSSKLPFSIAGIRFLPRAVGEVSLHPSEPLWLAFQLWMKPGHGSASQAADRATSQVKITYSYGRLQGGQMPISDSEEIDVSNVDASGDLLTGHMIPTTALEPGTYRLAMTVTDERQNKAYTSMSFHIVPWSEPTEMWTVYSADAAGNQSEALDDYKRGLSALAQSHTDQAAVWFKRSLTNDAQYLPALDGLVDTLTHSNRFAEVAALSKEHPVSHDLKERTAILMAEANGQIGHPEVGTRILEAELQFQAPSRDLYLALAKLYQTQGDTSKSEEFKRKAAILKN